MRQSGYIKTFFQTLVFPLLSQTKQKSVQRKRLQRLVAHVRRNSPFFAGLYKNIGEDFALSDLPVTTKQMMMEHFDDWITDRCVSMAQVQEFKKDKRNIGVRINNKYMVTQTSGPTGYPAIMLHDKTSQNVDSVLSTIRGFRFRLPICCVCVDDDFGVFNGTVRQNTKRYPPLKWIIRVVDAKKKPRQIIQECNACKPKVLIGYPGTLELLTDDAFKGMLNIKPAVVLTSGESLSDSVRAKLRKAFGCKVHSIYACTEGGTLAFECPMNHLHINSDWCILEPVDEDFNPVPFGEMAQKVLLTNLSNLTQPIIRYELTDRVVVHEQACACGKKGLWMEVEGRTGDILYFDTGEGKVGVAPMSLIDLIDLIDGVRTFQLILHAQNELEVRLVCMQNAGQKKTFALVEREVTEYLNGLGVKDVMIRLSEVTPQLDPKSGKFKQVYRAE